MRLKFRIWHLLVTMVFVALWLPLSRWLLALEAKDHPTKPQTTADFIGFYLGSLALIVIPMVLILAVKGRRKPLRSVASPVTNDD